LVNEQMGAVKVDGHAERALCGADSGDVIDVRGREQDVPDLERVLLDEGEQAGHFVSRIDQDRLAGLAARHDEAVLEERRRGLRFYYDHTVILAILDDLMFTSKIRTAATQLGVPVAFARSPDAALAEMRKSPPSLVIFDLNSARADPLAIVSAMKREAALASVPTVGFVSHVQADLIDAARQAGVDEVLARSAFTARLAEILRRP